MFITKFKTRILPLFAHEGGATGATGTTDLASGTAATATTGTTDNTATATTATGTASTDNTGGKVFTQAELNRIAAQEKRQGMASVLKSLGFEKEEDAKAFVEQYRKAEEEKKDELQKAQELIEAEKRAKAEAEKRADLLDKKFKVISAGVSADKADDIVTLACAKLTDGVDFDTALEQLKTIYPVFFEASVTSKGTGSGGTPPRASGKSATDNGIGKRLAEQRKTTQAQNSKSYFNN